MSTDPIRDAADRFARDTKNHVMTVLHDDGVYRHLRFAQPDRSSYWFDIVTWPGTLAIRGDFGDGFMFVRINDMFEFFRRNGNEHGINPGYWAEKVVDGRDRCSAYSQDKLRQIVAETVAEREEDFPGLSKAAEGALADEYNYEYEDGAREFLHGFEFKAEQGEQVVDLLSSLLTVGSSQGRAAPRATLRKSRSFRFEDAWEWDLQDWDWSFLWACHAIAWGIRQYDAGVVAPPRPPKIVDVHLPESAPVGGAA